jgi:predicted secreted protein
MSYTKTRGKDILLQINLGTISAPVWTSIGGQRDCSLGVEPKEIDASSKDSGNYELTETGRIAISIEGENVQVKKGTDNAFDACFSSVKNDTTVHLRMTESGTAVISGIFKFTKWSVSAQDEDMAMVSFTAKPSAAPTWH